MIETIECYKVKACKLINGNCDRCEAMHEYKNKQYCQFDPVIRFIKFANTIEWDDECNVEEE